MLRAKTVRTWYRTHKWTSLICTVFLLMSCITGLPLIFGDKINRLTDHHVAAVSVPKDTPLARLDDMVAASLRRYPNLKVLSVSWDEDEPRVFVDLAPNFNPKPGEDHTLIFDAHTGKLLEEPKSGTDFMGYVTELHTELFAGLVGQLFLCVMASLFVVALVSGFVVYGPFMRKLNFGTYRADSSRRVKWFDLHNLLGIVTLCWALVVGLTGVMNTLADPLFGVWRAQELPHLLAPYKGKPLPTQLGSVDAAVETARAAVPGTEITSVVFPNDIFSSPRHYLIWTKGKTTLTSRLFTPVLVDVQNGRATEASGLPWYLRVLEVCRPLHFGDYGGLPLKILWALLDLTLIVVLASGIYLWASRRRTPLEEELDVLVDVEAQGAQAVTE
ncbi:MAG: PepSY-associated TM helix domain-containing protein [Candidatus Acidiferrales bacterium]